MVSVHTFLFLVNVLLVSIVCGTMTEIEERKHIQSLQKILNSPVPIPPLSPNDRILFIGNMNGFYADVFLHGFIELFRQQVTSIPGYENVMIMHALLPNYGQNHEKFYEDHILPQTGSGSGSEDDEELVITELYQPTKIVYLLGNELLFQQDNSDRPLSAEALETRLQHIEKTCIYFLMHLQARYPGQLIGMPIILAPLFLHGEKALSENDYDDEWERLQGKLIQTTKFHQFAYLDLTLPLWKAIECWNVDNQADGLFTFDGKILNARGHQVIANTLTDAFGISTASSMMRYEGGNAYRMIWEEMECPAMAKRQMMTGPGRRRMMNTMQVLDTQQGEEDVHARGLLVAEALQTQRGIYEKLRAFQELPIFTTTTTTATAGEDFALNLQYQYQGTNIDNDVIVS
jgi:hypothetical protein